jgi:hypothetical protein
VIWIWIRNNVSDPDPLKRWGVFLLNTRYRNTRTRKPVPTFEEDVFVPFKNMFEKGPDRETSGPNKQFPMATYRIS